MTKTAHEHHGRTQKNPQGEACCIASISIHSGLRPQNITRIESSGETPSERARPTAEEPVPARQPIRLHAAELHPRRRDLFESLRLLVGVRVGADLLATGTGDHVDETTVVLPALLGAAGQSLLAVLLLGDLGGLALDLTGTCQRTVDLTTTTKAERQVKRALVLDAATSEPQGIPQRKRHSHRASVSLCLMRPIARLQYGCETRCGNSKLLRTSACLPVSCEIPTYYQRPKAAEAKGATSQSLAKPQPDSIARFVFAKVRFGTGSKIA